MAILGFELDEISRLIALVEEGDLGELIVEEQDRYLRIRGPRGAKKMRSAESPASSTSMPPPQQRRLPPAPRRAETVDDVPASGLPEGCVALVSPMVGVFYRSGKPDDPPFVSIGQRVELDDTIGIIEAMKIFSEVPAEHAGVVTAAPAQDGQLVQSGTPLVILKVD